MSGNNDNDSEEKEEKKGRRKREANDESPSLFRVLYTIAVQRLAVPRSVEKCLRWRQQRRRSHLYHHHHHDHR